MPTIDPHRCSAISRAADEPIAGTAQVGTRWLLIEHPGPWAPKPLESFPPDIASALAELCRVAGAVPMLLRRPGHHDVVGTPQVLAVDLTARTSASGQWTSFADITGSATKALADLDKRAGPAPDLVLVCTHGTRDACCAIRGRSVVEALLAAGSPIAAERVRECTHLGGHRFSGTAFLVPSGVVLGRLDAATAPGVVAAYDRGEGDVRYLRGLAQLSRPAQAAHAWAMETYAVGDPAAVTVLSEGAGTQGDATLVVLEARGIPVRVEVRRESLGEAPVSCGKEPEERFTWRVTEPA